MFQLTRDGSSLRENLINDNFFENNDTLNIIDDYNIIDINEEATRFFLTSFSGIGLRTINIYF